MKSLWDQMVCLFTTDGQWDDIHDRYEKYLNQSQSDKDATKTDYTYAKSFSYNIRVRVSKWYVWAVPNLCRPSLPTMVTIDGYHSQQLSRSTIKSSMVLGSNSDFFDEFCKKTINRDMTVPSKGCLEDCYEQTVQGFTSTKSFNDNNNNDNNEVINNDITYNKLNKKFMTINVTNIWITMANIFNAIINGILRVVIVANTSATIIKSKVDKTCANYKKMLLFLLIMTSLIMGSIVYQQQLYNYTGIGVEGAPVDKLFSSSKQAIIDLFDSIGGHTCNTLEAFNILTNKLKAGINCPQIIHDSSSTVSKRCYYLEDIVLAVDNYVKRYSSLDSCSLNTSIKSIINEALVDYDYRSEGNGFI